MRNIKNSTPPFFQNSILSKMICLKEITSTTQREYTLLSNLYEVSFPAEEKVDFQTLIGQENTQTAQPRLFAILLKEMNKVVGLASIVDSHDFVFLFYLATYEEVRGKGIGTEILSLIKKTYNKTIVLEVELPENGIATRRIEFYKRNGFHLLPYFYKQPALQEEMPEITMSIMSYPRTLTEKQFEKIKETIYTEAYKK